MKAGSTCDADVDERRGDQCRGGEEGPVAGMQPVKGAADGHLSKLQPTAGSGDLDAAGDLLLSLSAFCTRRVSYKMGFSV